MLFCGRRLSLKSLIRWKRQLDHRI
uniref:Uncharacterized protein n=1 Tax=Rhizophora mucronata TaxID=61149 RepID=A0A2P2PRS1_RHIMU